MANVRGSSRNSKSDTQHAVDVGRSAKGGMRKVARPTGYAGRTSSSGRGGLSDQALGANNRGSGGKGAPGTGLGSAGGANPGATGGTTSTTTNPGGTPTAVPPTSSIGGTAAGGGFVGAVSPPHATIESTFATGAPLSSARLGTTTPIRTTTGTTPSPAPLPLPSTVNGTQKGTAAYQGYGGPTGTAGVARLQAYTNAANAKAKATAAAKAKAAAQAKAEFNAKRNAAIAAAKKRAAAAARQAAYNKSRQGYGGPKGKHGVAQAKANKAAAAKKAKAAAAAKAKAKAQQMGTHGLNRGALQ